MTVQLSTLRVAPELDPSKYVAGAQEKVAADKAMAASAREVGQSASEANVKISDNSGLSRLLRTYVDGYGTAAKFESGMRTLNKAVDQGRISAEQYDVAIAGMQKRLGVSSEAARLFAAGQGEAGRAAIVLAANSNSAEKAIAGHTEAARLGATQQAALFHSVRSVSEQLMLGIPVTQAAIGQMNHLSYAMSGEQGLIAAMKGLGPVALGIVGLLAAAVIGVGVYAMTSRGHVKSLDEVMKGHSDTLRLLKQQYGDLAEASQRVGTVGGFAFTDASARSDKASIDALMRSQMSPLLDDLTGAGWTGAITGRTNGMAAIKSLQSLGGDQRQFGSAVTDLLQRMRDGKGDLDAFNTSIERTFDALAGSSRNPTALRATADAVKTLGAAAFEVNGKFAAFADPINKLKVAGPDGLATFNAEVEKIGKQQGLQKIADEAILAGREMVNLAEKASELEERIKRLNFLTDRPGLVDLRSLKEYVNQRAGQTLQLGQQHDAELQMIAARTNAEKLAAIEAQVRARSRQDGDKDGGLEARVNRAVETERARQDAERRNAQTERERGQARSIAAAREEIGLIGATTGQAARLRYEYAEIAKLREEAARRGVNASEAEIDAIKRTAEELGRLAEISARLNLRRDLQFERDQITRSPEDQQIASRLRGTGLGMDSDEAQFMRSTAVLEQRRQAIKDFLTTFQNELTRSGGNVGKALGASIQQALMNSMNKQLDHLFDQLANWLVGGISGTGSSGGGSLLSSIFGGGAFAAASGGLGAANDNYAAGAVTRVALGAPASTLGTAMGMVGNYKSGVDARLTDILSTAAERFGGYKVDAFSGFRAGDPRFHGKGLATDVRLTDLASGKVLGNYQDPSTFRAYEQFAQTARQVQLEKYPELADQFRWGGYFGGPRGKYGAMDQMHFDLGGGKLGMAGGSWQGGLTAAQKAMFPGVDSLGLGAAKTSQALDKLAASSASTAKDLTDGLGKLGSSLTQASGLQGGSSGGGLLSGLFDWVGSLFGFAEGTENAPPGWAWVGERGPELRKLRAGDVIRSNARSMQMAADNNNGGGMPSFAPVFHIDARGSTMSRAEFEEIADRQARAALAEYQSGQVRGGLGGVQRQFASYKG